MLLMDLVEESETKTTAPSVVDRYYTRWYRAGKYYYSLCEVSSQDAKKANDGWSWILVSLFSPIPVFLKVFYF